MHTPLSVISAKVKLALRCRSILSENTRVLKARRGSPEKKSVSPRYSDISNILAGGPVGGANVFQILEEISNSFPLVVGKDGLVEAVAGFPWAKSASCRQGGCQSCSTAAA